MNNNNFCCYGTITLESMLNSNESHCFLFIIHSMLRLHFTICIISQIFPIWRKKISNLLVLRKENLPGCSIMFTKWFLKVTCIHFHSISIWSLLVIIIIITFYLILLILSHRCWRHCLLCTRTCTILPKPCKTTNHSSCSRSWIKYWISRNDHSFRATCRNQKSEGNVQGLQTAKPYSKEVPIYTSTSGNAAIPGNAESCWYGCDG